MVKKSIATNPEYQATFLPLFAKAEDEIKRLIVEYWWLLKSKSELRVKILAVLFALDKRVPKTLSDRQAYMNGLSRSADKMITKVYDKGVAEFYFVSGELLRIISKSGKRLPNIKSPQKLVEYIKGSTWAEAKGVPYIENYGQKVKQFVKQLSEAPVITSETGKKGISLWQKAELDIRHQHQMEMVENLRTQGVQYAWLSTHANCSKRCEKWQGKLVDLNAHATMSGMRVGKKDGHWVYSLTDIMDQTDKYGYHNNIINGFNCRHKLVAYTSGSVAPREYSDTQIKKQRAVENKIREMERQLRLFKQQEIEYNTIKDFKNAKIVKAERLKLLAKYKSFCEMNGYAWNPYRI